MFEIITFDADDTLWHTDLIFVKTRHEFTRILSKYHNVEWIESNFSRTEINNLSCYGYGIKGFALSMIETAIELTEGRVSGSEIKEILDLAKNMQATRLKLLDGVRETVLQLSKSYKLMILTKGDLFDQEVKIAQSGLGNYINYVEVVSEKNISTYQRIIDKYQLKPSRFIMIGNSLKSDILPVLELGGTAIHIPYKSTWLHEAVPEIMLQQKNIITLRGITSLPSLLKELENKENKIRGIAHDVA